MANSIANAVQAGDKSGNWFMLLPTGVTQDSSGFAGANAFTANGSWIPEPDRLSFGGGTYLSTPAVSFPLSSFSMVAVIRVPTLAGGFKNIFGNFTGSGDYSFVLSAVGGSLEVDVEGVTGATATLLATPPLNTYVTVGIIYNASSGLLTFRVNGVTTTATVTGAGLKALGGPRAFSMGATTVGTLAWTGDSYGVFFTEKLLSVADVDRIGGMSTSTLSGDYLRINEIAASVLQVNASGDLSTVGASERAQDGTMRIERRALKAKYTFTLAHQTAADALAWRSLVLGRGQHWTLDATLYGSKGTPFTGTGVINSSTHGGKFGAKAMKVPSTDRAVAANAVKGLSNGFGFAIWFYFWNGSIFDHYLNVTNAAFVTSWYVNGVLASPSTGWFAVNNSTGTITLGDNSADRYFSDLVALDLPGGGVPANWPAALSAKTRAFTDLAQLDVDGRAIEAQQRAVTVQGAVGPASMVGASFNGAWNDTVHVLPVMFDEI